MSLINIKSLFSLSFLASICLSCSVYAEDTTINITSTPAISLTTSSNLVILDIEPLGNGVFKSTPFTVTAGTNNPNGYTLYFSVADDNNALVRNNNGSSNNSTGTNSIIALDDNGTTGYTPSTFTMNRWGYSIGTITSEGNDTTTYHPTPTISSPSIIDTYNAPINTRNITINLATKVDLATASGSYSKQLVVSMLPTVITYELSYDANTTDTVANLPTLELQDQWSDTTPSLTINTKFIPTRDGYNFKGYTTTNGGTTAEYAYDATTNTFTPSTLTPTTTSSTLYAVWEVGCTGIMASGTCHEYMQDFATNATTIKNAMVLEQQYQLKDSRDNKLYWVSKLKDGNVWMTQNLDLDITTAGLSKDDTDITSDWNSSSTYKPVATLTDATKFTNSSNTSTASWDGGDWYYDGTSSTSCGNAKTTYSGCTGFSSTGDAHRHDGNMYSWGAATAGTGGTITSGQVAGSICPKNWRLPMSSGDPSFANLQSEGSLGSTVSNWTGAPYYFVRGGLMWYDGGMLGGAGRTGYYWSSTPSSDSDNAYNLNFRRTSDVYPAVNNARALGMSVRCVAR